MIRSLPLTRSWLSPIRCKCVPRLHSSTLRSRAVTRAASTLPNLLTIDQKWQARWEDATSSAQTVQQARPDHSDQAYVLAMFPYPSGALHMGHLRVYTITDVLARFKRMQGHSVLYPMGWDAFGLPAENAAIERGIHPAEWTQQNTSNMRTQLRSMNGGMDWSKELMTSSPTFYAHTQKLFLLLHEHGLAYQAESVVNYDPIDRTVLANEQVDSNGHSWRSGAKVERISLRQWFLKISEFRNALLDDLDFLAEQGRWPERVLTMQRHWIGKSEGANIKFEVHSEPATGGPEQSIEVFSTRPDTLFGVQYLALSMSHPLVRSLAAHNTDLATFIDQCSDLPPDSKEGFQLPNVFATNPTSRLAGVTGFAAEPLPVFVAPYVLDSYGAGAVMGVPGHDTRDHSFWKHNRPSETTRYVVLPEKESKADASLSSEEALTVPGILSKDCSPYAGLPSKEASKRMIQDLSKAGDYAYETQTWRLRDWLISRQRYWGCPIPIIHCQSCGPVPVPSAQLPVELPQLDGSWFKSRSGNPLESDESWINTPCPQCGSAARRDTDTMDTFVDSSWYFFRFADAHNDARMFEPAKIDTTLPVDIYVGGIEHAILHLLYARFISKFLAKIGEWPAGRDASVRGEPFTKLLSQGMVHGKTFSDPSTGRFLKPDEVDLSDPQSPKVKRTGERPVISFEKMSKSKHNGVDPTEFISRYGADVTRAHILFQAPVADVLEWEEDRVVGVQRWFQRIWNLVDEAASSSDDPVPHLSIADYNDAELALHNSIRSAVQTMTEALDKTYALNTCISDLMELSNAIYGARPNASMEKPNEANVSPTLFGEAVRTMVLLLAPFAPAFASECWEQLRLSTATAPRKGQEDSYFVDVFNERFPTIDQFPQLAVRSQTAAIMQNGKLRFTVDLPVPPENLLEKAKARQLEEWTMSEIKKTEAGSKWLKDKQWKRIIVARSGKTINFVG